MQWAITEMRQFALINSHRSDNVYFIKVKRMLSVIAPPPFNEEEECKIANSNENTQSLCPKSMFADRNSEIKFEGQH